jgi:hypothetical protein
MIYRNVIIIILAFGLPVCSCTTNNPSVLYSIAECPKNIRESAVFFAQKYVQRNTVFEWGGRDFLEKKDVLEIDCSGLIVRAFQYAVKNTKYTLLFEDTNVSSLYTYFTVFIDIPTPGDLVFMGTEPNNPPTHMGIFVGIDEDNIYFIDSTLKEEDNIDGVTLRFYKKDDPKFLFFARLLVRL